MDLNVYIAESEVAVLNAARETLKAIQNRVAVLEANDNVRRDGGRLAEAADLAESLVFNVLNVAASHYHVNLSYSDLHGREKVTT